MESKKFKMIDEDFNCNNCHQKVQKLGYTARDHCPLCLYSKHVDNNPGDREANCGGDLIPIAIEKFKSDQFKIIYKCNRCGIIKKNIAANDDNIDTIIKIMSNPQTY